MVNVDIKQVNIVIEAGADYQMYFVLRDNSNNLIDLTGAVVEAQLREFPEAQDYLQFTATHNGSGGRVSISMPHEDTSAIPYTSGVYDVFITDTDNVRDKYLTGEVAVIPSVTKPVAGEIIYLLSFASEDDFPSYGMVRRLYFSHASNHIYRWNGTDYVDIVTDGEAATVEVGDVETLPAGSNATVENVGSLLNAVFDFGIPEGNGIASIEKTGTDVLTDTYTVTFTDPSVEAFDFDVTNGKGIVSIAEVVSGLTHTFTVTFNDGDTFTYTLTDGNGIVSIEKTGATDNVDHYRITFDDGTYFDYNVTNVDTSEFYDKDEVDTLLADKADVGDSYTKDEEDALLADKADSADLGDLASKDTVDWDSDIDNIPSTFPPEGHNHDDRYYTETEMDSLLADKADADDVYTKDDVDDALADKADSADVYTKTETDTLLLTKAPVILNSASGSIASFSDGAASPVTALSVSIDPVQDLHGYDNPWPAGGGKNILNWTNTSQEINGVTFTVNADGTVKANGTAGTGGASFYSADPNSVSIKAGSYILSGCPSGGSNDTYFMNEVNYSKSDLGSGVSLTLAEDTTIKYRIVIREGVQVTNMLFKPMICLSTTTNPTTFAPYENICPISGWDEAMVMRTGKNLFDKNDAGIDNGYWSTDYNNLIVGSPLPNGLASDNVHTSAPISVKPNTTYTVVGNRGNYPSFLFLDKDLNFVSGFLNESRTSLTFTVPNNPNIAYLRFPFNAASPDTCQLELGSSASSYEPYQGTSVTIDLDGTRYGAMYDALTGEMTVTKGIVDLGTLTWTTSTSGRHNASRPNDIKTVSNTQKINAISDRYIMSTGNNIANYDMSIAMVNSSLLQVNDSTKNGMDAADFKTAMNGVQLVYELATPLTVQLTPAQLSTLLGQNNIWADTGDTSVTYRADTKLFIEGQIAETLDAVKKAKQIITDVTTEMVAPRNLAEGDYVIVGDDLLKTTATVASGSTLTIGINCVKTTVAEALIALATASE